MTATSATYPGTVSTVAVLPEDDVDWTNPNNVKADDATAATCASMETDKYSYQLKCQNFGFSLPAGATIDGILVEIDRRESATNDNIYDYRVQLLNAAGALVGDNKASAAEFKGNGYEVISYGGATDKWNATPTEAMVEDADFGVVLSCRAVAGATATASIDFIRMTIYYTSAQTYPQSVVVTAIGSPVLSKVSSFYRTLPATAIGSMSLTKGLWLDILATAIGNAVLDTTLIFSRTLTAVAQGVSNLSKVTTYIQSLVATALANPILTKITTHYLNIGTTASGVVQIVKGISKTLSATAVGSAVVAKVMTAKKILEATASVVANVATEYIAGGGVIEQVITAVAQVVAEIKAKVTYLYPKIRGWFD